MNNDPQDIITVIVALLALIVSKEVAHLVGPYAGIIVLACAGTALSLSGNDSEMTHWQATRFVLIRVLVAVSVTVAIAELIQGIAPWAKPRYTLVPLAFGIGWVRDYEAVRVWLVQLITKFVSRKTDGQ